MGGENAFSSSEPNDISSRQPLETAQQAEFAETIEREAQELESQDLKAAWAQSLKSPIDIVSERFSSLELCGRKVDVVARCDETAREDLYQALKSIDPNYVKTIRLKSEAKKIPQLVRFMHSHCERTPYSFAITKCDTRKTGCRICGPVRCPESLRPLVMQLQPTPVLDKKREGHFVGRESALEGVAKGTRSLIDLSDLPSVQINESSKEMKERKTRDSNAATRVIGSKGFDASMVGGVVHCWACNKPRCLFSKTQELFDGITGTVQCRNRGD